MDPTANQALFTSQGSSAADFTAIATARARSGTMTEEQAQQIGRDFEAMFVAQMMAPMFEGLDTDGPFGGGMAEKTFRSLLLDEYGKEIAKSNSLGIADSVARELLQLQEVQ
jgi:Rod binding domain-containing protein|tara:strand:+ start:10649 stop:10984 length:336 start_codon:yes stop_codon:yes gene_type:complete